jgi:membrane dipeptidase
VRHHNGLTDFGKQVVLEMNRLGMMVDISHVADKTFWDTIAVTKAPVIASHSSSRALVNAPRNMTDDMLRAVAKNGGVVQVNFYSGFDDEDFRKANAAQAKDQAAAVQKYLDLSKARGQPVNYIEVDRIEREWMARIPRPPFHVLIDHIDHIAKVAGVDHVGLGSDFDGVSGATPQGMDSAADLPRITQGLLDRGYSETDIKKILGGNLLRVFAEVEKVSREMQPHERNMHEQPPSAVQSRESSTLIFVQRTDHGALARNRVKDFASRNVDDFPTTFSFAHDTPPILSENVVFLPVALKPFSTICQEP